MLSVLLDWVFILGFIILAKVNHLRLGFEKSSLQQPEPFFLTFCPHDVQARIGEQVILRCGTKEKTTIEWYHHGLRVDPGKSHLANDLIVVTEDGYSRHLLIKSLVPSLVGRYHCKIYNKTVVVRKGASVKLPGDCNQDYPIVGGNHTKSPGDSFLLSQSHIIGKRGIKTLWTKSLSKNPYKLFFYQHVYDHGFLGSRVVKLPNESFYIRSLNVLDQGLWREITYYPKGCATREIVYNITITDSEAEDCGHDYYVYTAQYDNGTTTMNSNIDADLKPIVGGRKDSTPAFVGLCGGEGTRTTKTEERVYCGGTLINKKWMVTAAHCLYRKENKHRVAHWLNEAELTIKLGSQDPICDVNLNQNVKSIHVHPMAKHGIPNGNYTGDIALIELEREEAYKKSVWPICLERSAFYADQGLYNPGRYGKVFGMGKQSDIVKAVATNLQSVELPIMSKSECDVDEYTICAGYQKGGKDACKGDSGGPYTMDVQGRSFLVGIVSWGNGCGDKYGHYTKVGEFFTWIRQTIRKSREHQQDLPDIGDILYDYE